MKTLNNLCVSGASQKVPDLKISPEGTGDTWKLLCKASSKKENWMKSTKILELKSGHGCLVQVTTQQGNHVAEAVTFVQGASFEDF